MMAESTLVFRFGVRASTEKKTWCGKDTYMLKVVSSEKI